MREGRLIGDQGDAGRQHAGLLSTAAAAAAAAALRPEVGAARDSLSRRQRARVYVQRPRLCGRRALWSGCAATLYWSGRQVSSRSAARPAGQLMVGGGAAATTSGAAGSVSIRTLA